MKKQSILKSSKLLSVFASKDTAYSDSEIDTQSKSNKPLLVSLFMLKLRTSFAKKSEVSATANFIEYLYYSLLSCSLSVYAIFFAVFGVSSFVLRYSISASKLEFLTNSSNWLPILIFIISLLFMPVKKDLAFMLNQSKLFSLFEFSYDAKILSTAKKGLRFYSGYSTSFFIGLLSGIISVLFSPSSVLLVIILAFCFLMIINRPECGILLSVFFVPFFSIEFLNSIIVVTFVSMMYKYFRMKRHVGFGRDETLLCILVLIFILYGFFNVSGVIEFRTINSLIISVMVFLCVKNLIKSIALFNNTVRLIAYASFILSVLSMIYYIAYLIYGNTFIIGLKESEFPENLVNNLINNSFVPIFIASTFLLNFSLSLGISSSKKIKYIILLIIQFACIMIYNDIKMIYCVLFSACIVLSFYKIKTIFALPFIPFAANLVHRLCSLLPSAPFKMNSANYSQYGIFSSLLKRNWLFGIGLGAENLEHAVKPELTVNIEDSLKSLTSFKQLIVVFGIPIGVFIIVVIAYFLYKNLINANKLKGNNALCDSTFSGLFGTSICIILIGLCTEISSSAAAAFLSIICAMCGCIEKCVKSDHLGDNKLRIY